MDQDREGHNEGLDAVSAPVELEVAVETAELPSLNELSRMAGLYGDARNGRSQAGLD